MRRSIAPRLAGILAAVIVTLVVVPSVLAKDGVEVQLDGQIAADARPGDTVDVFFRLTRFDDAGSGPLRDAAVFVRLTGPRGDVTEADGVELSTPGQYKAQIVIPAGGAYRAAFGMHSASGRPDVVWPYDGGLVVGQHPAPVDPDVGQPQMTKPQIVVPKDATEPVPAVTPATTPASTTAPAFDARAVGGVALAALVAVAVAAAYRRRFLHPTTA